MTQISKVSSSNEKTYRKIVEIWQFRGELVEGAFVDIKISELCKVFQVVGMEIVMIVIANHKALDSLKFRFAVRFKTFILLLIIN